MGASQFMNISTGKTPEEAFHSVTASARYEHGHGGYSGTIAEKHEYRLLTTPSGVAALDLANWALKYAPPERRNPQWPAEHLPKFESEVRQIARAADDKWGPAVALEILGEELEALRKGNPNRFPKGERVFVFFGWASS